ncbi:MAG: efflux transporter outer membrane subunit [Rhodocyclaceae bacterium]|nr:efflux transporter outer membrane subunit [Rhodocyclaceae bacterium]
MMRLLRILSLIAASAVLAGCAVQGPQRDEAALLELPAQWRQAGEGAAAEVRSDWWRAFGSAELDRLVSRAEHDSLDLSTAVMRVRQAEASARIAGAALLPEVAAGLDGGRRGSLEGDGSAGSHGAALDARFEVDFWGRHRAGRDSAVAMLQATAFDRDTVRLTVTAGVASAWLNAVALRERIGIAERNLQSAERLLELVESRVRAGAATPLALAQQRGLAVGQRRSLTALQQQAEAARTALAVLLAQPGGIEIGETSLATLETPDIGAGLPSELLVRRPDIARAEALLASAEANVRAARAAMLPSLTLAAGVSAEGDHLRRAFDNPVYSLAAGLAAPIFNAGRLAAGHELAQARREERLANYRQAIVDAFADVELVLNAVAGLDAQAALQAEELAQAQRALTLAESRYRAGAESLLTLLDTQRTLYAAQDAAAQLRLARLSSSVALYRALGGGWRVAPAVQAMAAEGAAR